ncbi:hypothetical protein IFM89_016619 [Coptis chinensis]|uniref:ACT domain-containing protein ACR n=1 Tax=Coptis chinensis TaxID=261450 RepID=A0A835ILF2_9MAGN|nr:hypothetical protein IFM89_016619 [Coptis chinensis]
MMNSGYKPYLNAEFEALIERIHPPSVSIDNETCKECTLVKVDSANRHGILLEMVQVLTDLDLIISKSYICSDGGWFMDVFHVTDQLGNKLTDEHLIHYIQQALCAGKKGAKAKAKSKEAQRGNLVDPIHVPTDQLNVFEMTVTDRPGLLSEVSAVIVELGLRVVSAVSWTHNTRAACIMYLIDDSIRGPITDPDRLSYAEEQLVNVVGAHHYIGERRRVSLSAPEMGRTHTERRLHQLMYADRDYDLCCCGDEDGKRKATSSCSTCCGVQVSIESCNERGYSVVNVTSRDRPKLLFDTVCTLTDMKYVVFHASVSSQGSLAAQGLRLDVCTQNKVGLLSDISRVFRESGMSVSRADLGTHGDQAIGSFYVTDSSGNHIDPKTVDLVRNEIGEKVLKVNKSSVWDSERYASSSTRSRVEDRSERSSLGSILWSQLERFSSNFGPIRS